MRAIATAMRLSVSTVSRVTRGATFAAQLAGGSPLPPELALPAPPTPERVPRMSPRPHCRPRIARSRISRASAAPGATRAAQIRRRRARRVVTIMGLDAGPGRFRRRFPTSPQHSAGNGRIPHRGGNPAGTRADAVRDKGCPHAPDSAAPESGRIAGRGPVGELLRLEAGRGVLSSDKPLEVSIWRSQQVSAGADAVLPEMLDSSFQAMTRRRYMRPWRFSMAAVTEPLGSLRLTNSTPAAREARSYGTCLTRENSAKSRVQPSASAPSPTGSTAPDRAGRRW